MSAREGAVGYIARLLTVWNSAIEKAPALFACGVLLIVGVIATARSSLKPYWYDELANFDVARLPTLSAVWEFFASGLDTPGPLPSLIQHLVIGAFGNGEVVNRLPVEAGFLLMCFCLYLFVSRRYSPGFALCALIIPGLADVFYFATELRAYGLVLGGTSLALLCWQRAQSPNWRAFKVAGLFIGLSFALACHAFAIFAVIPFLLGQIVRERETRKRDYAIWTAIGLSPIWLLFEYPGMHEARKYYAAAFWSKPHVSQILESYSLAISFAWAVPILFALLLYTSTGNRYGRPSERSTDAGFSRAEWTSAFALALLPAYTLPASYLLGAYVPRYTTSAVIGVSLIVMGAVAEAVKRNHNFGSVLAALLIAVFLRNEHVMLIKAWHNHTPLRTQFVSQRWMNVLEASPLPVLVPNATLYLPTQYYASPDLERRLFYTLHTPPSIGLDETPGNELNMKLFAQMMPLRVLEFSSFIAEHPQFLVLVENPMDAAAQTGNPKIEIVGTFKPEGEFARSYYSVYLVTAASGSD